MLDRKEYLKPTAFNKWFFGNGSNLDLQYDIPKDRWDRIKLSGWNLGHLLSHYRQFQPINKNKSIDVCAIYNAKHPYNEDHGTRNDLLYSEHRERGWKTLSSKYNSKKDKLPFEEYIDVLYNSKVAISPFGMGEVCYRDFECMQFGTIIIKPSMEKVNTIPNIYIDNDTYISVDYNWSNLNEKIDYILDNFNELNEKINNNLREMFLREYSYEKLCIHWYEIFAKLNTIEKYKNE